MLQSKRFNALIPAILVLAAAIAWQAGANTAVQSPPAQPTAVATIDIVQIFEQLNERTVLESQLDARVKARQAQLEEISARLKNIQADLEGTLKPGTDDYKEKVREFMEQRAVADARRNALTQIISIDRGAVRRQLYEKMTAAVAKIAERDGIDIVLFDDSGFEIPANAADDDVFRAIVTKGVIYSRPTVDLTQRVVTLMNNEFTAP